MIPGLFDSHCHLDLEPLLSQLPALLEEAAAAGVTGFVVPGVHPDGWPGIAAVAARDPRILPAYGIHPMHADRATDEALGRLREIATQGVAIGETGLDPGYPVAMELQELAFRGQLQIAAEFGLPLLIHCRRAFQRVLKIMREERAERGGGIMHAFSGSVEMAREFIRLGFAISVSGTVTWHNALKPLTLVRGVPPEYLVLETDAPDMTPQRYRGAFNRPAWIRETALKVAEIRGMSPEEIAALTAENARRVLRLGAGQLEAVF